MQIVRKLFLSILSVIFAIISLTASTYAWFSTTTVNYVDSMEITISTASLLNISLDGENYYETLTSEMVYEALGKENILLDNVTTTNQNVFTRKEGSQVIPNTDYITLTLWFRSEDIDKTALFLENNVSNIYNYNYVYEHSVKGTYVISNGITLVNDYTYNDGSDVLVEKGESKKYYASAAMRIGFQELNVDNNTLLNPDTRLASELKSMIFDPSEDETRGFGVTYGAYDYFLKKTGMNLTLPSNFPTTIYKLSEFINPYQAYDNNSLIAMYQLGVDEEGQYYNYAKVQLNIWLEGWDADCMNGIMYDSILMQLSFRGSNPA